jgi:hypothetical protein
MAYPKRPTILLAGLLAYGGVIEVLQAFKPDRKQIYAAASPMQPAPQSPR